MQESMRNEAASKSTGPKNNICNLQDSEFTLDSSENEQDTSGAGWFGGMGTEFLNCLTENVSPVVSGVATLVHKTAVAVANEIAQLERDGELEAEAVVAAERFVKDSRGVENEIGIKGTADRSTINASSSFDTNATSEAEYLILPWEIRQESSHNSSTYIDKEKIPVYITDTKLMKRILALSYQESTFLGPFSENSPEKNVLQTGSLSSYSSNFVMNEPRIKLTHRLLDTDKNLASVHSRLTGVSNLSATFFWKNYFFHCEKVRAEELCRRKTKAARGSSNSPSKLGGLVNFALKEKKIDLENTKGSGDDESLVPVESDVEGQSDDDSSYVIQSAPNTGNSFATTRSIDDGLVMVDTQEKLREINHV